MSKLLSRFHWYRRYPNSYPRYAVTPISDSVIIFVPKYTFIIPLPRFWVDRNTRKWLDDLQLWRKRGRVMPRFYVEKDGEWNIFSTIVDDFLLDEFVCLDALKARLLYERYKELTEDLDSLLTDKPSVNVMDYEEAMKMRREQTEPQTEGVWNAGYKTGYDKGFRDAQKVNDSQSLVKDLVKAFGEDGTWLERQGVYTLTLAEAKQRAVDIIESVLAKTEPQTERSNE